MSLTIQKTFLVDLTDAVASTVVTSSIVLGGFRSRQNGGVAMATPALR